MIVACPNCKKRFQIDPTLVPVEGRDLQCGVCEHVWFYKIEKETTSPLTLNENLIDKKSEDISLKKETQKISENKEKKIKEVSDIKKTEIKKENTVRKFFSYIIVLIVSFVALIILIDTLKAPIINVFPGVEIILFNLFETLKDIKLFIIDLI